MKINKTGYNPLIGISILRTKRKSISCLLFQIFLFFGAVHLPAQTTVAVGEFINQSETFYLDQWEQSVPELLQTELARSEKLILVERRKLQALLEEKALALTGLTDSSDATELGKLLEAQYLIYGQINEIDGQYRIDATIVKTASGQLQSEKVIAPDREHLSEMIELLSNNILFNLTGEGEYKNRRKLGKSPKFYFLGATVGLGITATVFASQYNQYQDDYRNNTELEKFDELYDKANRTKKLSVAFAGATGAALLGTVYFWIKDRSPAEIYAGIQEEKSLIPYLTMNRDNEITIGIQIHY